MEQQQNPGLNPGQVTLPEQAQQPRRLQRLQAGINLSKPCLHARSLPGQPRASHLKHRSRRDWANFPAL